MAEERPKSRMEEALRHPMANVIIGFLLTGVIGTSITQYYSMKRQEETRHQQQIEARKQAVSRLSSLNGELFSHAERLIKAIEQGNLEQIEGLKKPYNDAILHWKAENHATMLIAREVLPDAAYYRFRGRLREAFQERFLVPINNCLEQARHAASTGASGAEVLSSCNMRAIFEQARACSELLIDLMYDLSSASMTTNAKRGLRQQWERYEKLLADVCAAPAKS